MQYKIPVQIENEDTIFLGLSLRQLSIIMVGGGIAYSIFTSLEPNTGGQVALLPAGLVLALAVVVALFRSSEMTFLPFILNLIRMKLNNETRVWSQGVDSYSRLEVGYVTSSLAKEAIQANKSSGEIFETIESKLDHL
ncbi:MAG TPA: PrgI family protein [bacterium]|nr:PrgI family protein [bacterium]